VERCLGRGEKSREKDKDPKLNTWRQKFWASEKLRSGRMAGDGLSRKRNLGEEEGRL